MTSDQIIKRLESRYEEVKAVPFNGNLEPFREAVTNRFVSFVRGHDRLWQHFDHRANYRKNWALNPSFLAALNEAIKSLKSARKIIFQKYGEDELDSTAQKYWLDGTDAVGRGLPATDSWKNYGYLPDPKKSIKENLEAFEDERRYKVGSGAVYMTTGTTHSSLLEFVGATGLYSFLSKAIWHVYKDKELVNTMNVSLGAAEQKLRDALINEPQRMGCASYEDVDWARCDNRTGNAYVSLFLAGNQQSHQGYYNKTMASLKVVKGGLVEFLQDEDEAAAKKTGPSLPNKISRLAFKETSKYFSINGECRVPAPRGKSLFGILSFLWDFRSEKRKGVSKEKNREAQARSLGEIAKNQNWSNTETVKTYIRRLNEWLEGNRLPVRIEKKPNAYEYQVIVELD